MNMCMVCLKFFFLLNIKIASLNSINYLLQWLCTLHKVVNITHYSTATSLKQCAENKVPS